MPSQNCCNAAGVTADNGSIFGSSAGDSVGRLSGWLGASSKITWTLVPLMPNELTPARRGVDDLQASVFDET